MHVIALDKIYIPYQYLFGIRMYSTSQVLEVVRNGKNSIFLLILLNLSPDKSPLNQNYPKPAPNPDSLIISLLKNDKLLVLAKILFLTSFSKQCKSVTLKCIGGADFRPRIFFKLGCHHMFKSLFCNLHEVSYKI